MAKHPVVARWRRGVLTNSIVDVMRELQFSPSARLTSKVLAVSLMLNKS